MATHNLDELLTFAEDHVHTYEDEHPNAGIPQATFGQDHFAGGQLKMFYKNHRGTDLYNTYSIGGWEEGHYHRAVDQGPRINGPHAWMNENPTVLTAHRQVPRPAIMVEPGDTVLIRGAAYTIVRDDRWTVRLAPAG